jgi:cytochrome c peroxidase
MRRLVLALVAAWPLLLGASAGGWRFDLPAWAPRPIVPADNPMSAAKVELGRRLFYDKRLSATGEMSCASCHEQARAFTDGQPTHRGVHGEPGLRNAMALANLAYLPTLTWSNPNIRRLEDQVLIPVFGARPVEMGMEGQETALFRRLSDDAGYRRRFAEAFPGTEGKIDLSSLTKALATFLRSLTSFDSAYDRYKHGDDANALSAAAKRGEALFFGEALECSHCHSGPTFTDNLTREGLAYPESNFHNTGLYNLDGQGAYPADNPGLREFTGAAEDEGKFRTPSLRNVALTAPYMHDGSIATLEAVVRDHYARGGRAASSPAGQSPLRDPLIEAFPLSEQDVSDLVAFLRSLTDERFVTNPAYADPFEPTAR